MTDDSEFLGIDQAKALHEEFSALFPEKFETSGTEEMQISPADLDALYLRLSEGGGPTALCLSGGGIRSATFSLGVLQALASQGWLKRFDYLSTVSGGGFIGSFLSRLRSENLDWTEESLSETEDNFRYTREDVHPVRRLRSFSNYLTPRWGVTGDSLAIANETIRKFAFNFLFWILLFLGIACALRAITIGTAQMAGLILSRLGMADAADAIFMSASAGIGAMLGLGTFLLFALSLIALLQRSADAFQERISLAGGWIMAIAAGLLIGQLVFVLLPDIAQIWLDGTGQTLAFAFATGGVSLVAALSGLWSRAGPELLEHTRKLQEILKIQYLQLVSGLALALLGIAAGWTARSLPIILDRNGSIADSNASGWVKYLTAPAYEGEFAEAISIYSSCAAIFMVAACLMAIIVGPNSSSLHSIYARRLIKAFLGSASDSAGSTLADADIPLAALPGGRVDRTGKRLSGVPPKALFHVINMTVNLSRAGGHRRDWQERRGAAFIATPLHTGSSALPLGYVHSEDLWDFSAGKGLSLGRAMTISGAAASPNMGYYGRFLTALAMAVFNVRLGWWLQNPGKMRKGSSLIEQPRLGFFQAWREAFSLLDEKSDWIYLSDGGHFDNLGLYEMVRRRCAQIFVIDAGCDGAFEYDDLHRVVRKIQVDFGIPIDLPSSLPGQSGVGKDQRFVVGTIRYSVRHPGLPDGRLILLKPQMTGNEPPSLQHYRGQSRSGRNLFPHHSTADQFFDETQFESYRVLGWISGEAVVNALPLAFEKAATYDVDRFYPLIARDEQPSAKLGNSAMPSPLNDPELQPKRNGGARQSEAQGGAFFVDLADRVREWTAGELVVRSIGAVALVGVTAGAAVKAGDSLVKLFLPPAAGTTTPATPTSPPDKGQNREGGAGAENSDTAVEPEIADPGEIGGPTGELDPTESRDDISGLERNLDQVRSDIQSLTRRVDMLIEQPGAQQLRADVLELQRKIGALRVPPDDSSRRNFELRDLQNRLAWLSARVDALDPARNVRAQ